MVDTTRRYFLRNLGIGLGLGVIGMRNPSILHAGLYSGSQGNVSARDLYLINWLKKVGTKTVEDKYEMVSLDGKIHEQHKGSITYYETEAVLRNKDKWGVVYVDSGPVSKDTGLFSADGIPNEYDSLHFDLRSKPLLKPTLGEPIDFYAKLGYPGSGLYSGRLGGGKPFLSPNSLEYRIEFNKFLESARGYEGSDKVIREKELRSRIKSDWVLFEAADKAYWNLRQDLMYAIYFSEFLNKHKRKIY